MPSRDRELYYCTSCKTLLMITIVFYHSILYWRGDWFTGNPICSAPLLGILASWIQSFVVYAFVGVSGYIFSYLMGIGRYRKFLPFVLNKIKRLLVPYLFAMLLWVMPISAYFYQYSWTEIFNGFILAKAPGQLWFLWMLFDVFLISWPLYQLFIKRRGLALIYVLLLYPVGILAGKLIPNVYGIWNATSHLPFFWMGILLQRDEINFVRKIPKWAWIVLDVLLFILLQFINARPGFVFKVLNLGLSFLLHAVGLLGAFFVYQALAQYLDNKKIIKRLSQYSFPIYLFHQQIIFAILWMLNGKINPYLHIVLNFSISILVSVLLSSILLNNKVTAFLIGSQTRKK